MKIKSAFFSYAIFMTFVFNPLFGKSDLTGLWEGVYLNNHMQSGTVKASAYQLNDSVFGSISENGANAVFYGRLYTTNDSLHITMISESGNITYVECLVYGDSISYTYAQADSSYYGAGHALRTGVSRTLIVNYNYTGQKEISTNTPLGIELFDQSDILSSPSINRLSFTDASGKVYFTGISSDTIYALAYTWVSDSINFFNSFLCSYAVYGNSQTLDCDTIVINDGEMKEITINFDDTYEMPFDANFPGGKLSDMSTVSLPYKPKSITSDQEKNIYIIDNVNNVLRYNQNIEFQDTLKNGDGSVINAYLLKFAPDSSFYVLYGSEIIHYSKTHNSLGSVSVGSDWADMAIDANGNIFYASTSEITRFNADLSSQTATLNLSAIKTAYPDIDVLCEIRSIAINKDYKVAISIDAEPDNDGKDVVLFYNDDLSQFDRAIWEEWLFNNPINIDFDAQGNTYVLSYWYDIAEVFDASDKRYQASYWDDMPGTMNGAMDGPKDLTLVGNNIYVIENVNNRVSIYSLNCPSAAMYTETIVISSDSTINWHGIQISQAGEYYDSLTNTQGCDSIYKLIVTVKLSGINSLSEKITVYLYPNPANEMLNIKLYSGTILQKIVIKDMSGRQVFEAYGNQTEFCSFNITNLVPGLYAAQIITDKCIVCQTFIKSR